MKTIGLLGGMSWQSSQYYYAQINQLVADQLGGLSSAKVAMVSVDFAPIAQLQAAEDWPAMAAMLSQSAQQIACAGAECLLICTNTMHAVADDVAAAVDIPLIHIADATGAQLQKDGVRKVALLGTAFTMQKAFYKDRLKTRFHLDVLVPNKAKQDVVHRVIYEELCLGNINASSKSAYIDIIEELVAKGAEAVILGCTEIGLLIEPKDVSVPVYDTVELHARAAVDFALEAN
ncbi:MAG: amino acid racemase [Alteromonadaceae bacterium]|nr:amino acid racemase [Alteromonadaceae bacterium]